MNILLAFKPEPDASMLAEKDWQAAALGTCGPDVSLLRSAIGADEQAAAALLLAQRGAGCEMTLTALSIGDERALHWLRYFAALGFERQVLLEEAGDLRFAPSFIAGQLADWQRSHASELIVTGCQSSEGQNGQTPFLLAEMLNWPCFTQVERFTLEPPFIVIEQRTTSGIRRCQVRLAAAKAEVARQVVTVEATPAIQCLRLIRPEQRRCAEIIEGATAQEKARSLWENYLRQRMQP